MKLFDHRQRLFKGRKPSVNVRKEIPSAVFETCSACHASIPYHDLIAHQYVCPSCGHHLVVSAHERLRQLCDADSFREWDAGMKTPDNGFPGYIDKLEHLQQTTALKEAVICGRATIEGLAVAIGVMDNHFMMGSMGSVVGEKITRCIEAADRRHLPLILVCTSGGARMQEGMFSLVQMAKTSAALKRFSEHKGLYISVLTHPTTGGVSASFAMLGDIILAEPGALVGFAGRRVIEDTIHEKLPEAFQTAEFVLKKGFIDRIVPRSQLKSELAAILHMHGGK